MDFENAGGRGISQALGLAGETNLDVVRNPTLSTAPYLARGEIHQIIGLTDEMTDQDRGPFALATKVPVRRFEIRIGKMSLAGHLRRQLRRLGQPFAVHQLDDRQQRRVGLRGRHARLHRGRNSGVRRQASGRRATPSPRCQRLRTASRSTGRSAAPMGRTGSSSCAKGFFAPVA